MSDADDIIHAMAVLVHAAVPGPVVEADCEVMRDAAMRGKAAADRLRADRDRLLAERHAVCDALLIATDADAANPTGVAMRIAADRDRLAAEVERFFDAKAAWSRETFGPGDRYAGVIAHIRRPAVTRAEWAGHDTFWTLTVGHFSIEVWRQGGGWPWDVTVCCDRAIARGRSGPECASADAAKAAAVAALRKVLTDALEALPGGDDALDRALRVREGEAP